jgi:hypothetical protein
LILFFLIMSHKKKTLRKRKTSNNDDEQRKSLTLTADLTKLSFFDEIEDESDITECKLLIKPNLVTQSNNTQEIKNIEKGTNISFNDQISKAKLLENLFIKGANKRLEIRVPLLWRIYLTLLW